MQRSARLAGDETARITALLYLVVPASALITLHTDSVIFPALCAGVVWMVVVAAARDKVWWAIAAGVLLYVSAFFTFALLAALPLALLSATTVDRRIRRQPARRSPGGGPHWRHRTRFWRVVRLIRAGVSL